ncbi:nucleoside-diphosphate kinase [candidate division KSB1 bacterium]
MDKRTLAILKPDCIESDLAGKVIDHLLQKGFKILACKMMRLTRNEAAKFYEVHKDRHFFNDLLDFMTSDRVIVLALENENAVETLREVIGATDPAEAAEGTVRKLYAGSKQCNIIHASDSDENARQELHFFFSRKDFISNLGE